MAQLPRRAALLSGLVTRVFERHAALTQRQLLSNIEQ